MRLSVPCEYWMALLVFSVQRAALSLSLRTYGVRLILTMYHVWHSLIRWTSLVQNFYGAVEQIKTRLGKNPIVLQLPIGKEDEFKGIIDLFEMQAYIYNDDKGEDIAICDIPEDMQDDAELYHTELIEKICELDDDLMMQYLKVKSHL